MFLVPVPKGPTCLTCIFYCASWMVTLLPIYNHSFAGDVLGGHFQILDGVAPPEMNLNSCFTTHIYEALTQAF